MFTNGLRGRHDRKLHLLSTCLGLSRYKGKCERNNLFVSCFLLVFFANRNHHTPCLRQVFFTHHFFPLGGKHPQEVCRSRFQSRHNLYPESRNSLSPGGEGKGEGDILVPNGSLTAWETGGKVSILHLFNLLGDFLIHSHLHHLLSVIDLSNSLQLRC